MNKRSSFLAAAMLSIFLVFGSIWTPVMAASTDHDLTIGFTAVDDNYNYYNDFNSYADCHNYRNTNSDSHTDTDRYSDTGSGGYHR